MKARRQLISLLLAAFLLWGLWLGCSVSALAENYWYFKFGTPSGTVDLMSGQYLPSGGTEAQDEAPTNGGYAYLSINGDTATLTLHNYQMSCGERGIYLYLRNATSGGALNVVLEGESSIDVSQGSNYAMAINDSKIDVNFSGTGSLALKGGIVAFHSMGNVTVEAGCSITAVSSESQSVKIGHSSDDPKTFTVAGTFTATGSNCGIYCAYGSLIVKNGGTLVGRATATGTKDPSYTPTGGVQVFGSITVEQGGTLVGRATAATNASYQVYGVWARSYSASGSGRINSSGTVKGHADRGTGSTVSLIGIHADGGAGDGGSLSVYSVVYNANDGSSAPAIWVDSDLVGAPVTLLGNGGTEEPAFAKAGANFHGWAVDSPSGQVKQPGDMINLTGSTTLYAQWKNTYAVTLNTDGGKINSGEVSSYTYGVGATLPTDVTRDGYTFAGWYEDSGFSGNAVTRISSSDTGDKVYYAKWTANTYAVTLKTKGGKINSGKITGYTYGVGATLPTDVTRGGYVFAGWYKNANFSGSPVKKISASETGAKTYYAKWIKKCEFSLTGKVKRKKAVLTWTKVADADGYDLFSAKCGNELKKIKTFSAGTTTWTSGKKCSGNYLYFVKAFATIDGKKQYIGYSNVIHLTFSKKRTNVTRVKAAPDSVSLSKGKKKKLSVTVTRANSGKKIVKHMRKLTYKSSDTAVATVTSKGVIQGKKKGTCTVTVIAHSGVRAKVKVVVK